MGNNQELEKDPVTAAEAMNAEAADTKTMETEAAEKETANAEAMNAEAAEKETANAEAMNAEAEDKETANAEAAAAESSEESAQTGEEGKSEKKGFFGKKKDKKDKKDERIEELEDRVKRQLAEFENFRNRTEKEKSRMFESGARDVIEKMLPVVDNFERGLASIPEDDKSNAIASGMEMIYKQLMTTLDGLGVKAIEAVGKEFDPNLHNAVMHIDDEELGENVVAEEFQKGYLYRDTVIRHSMVKVAN